MTNKSTERSSNKDKDHKQNVPELRFREFDGEWNETKLGQISNIHDGTHGTHQNVEKGKYLLSAENIENGKVVIKDEPRIISEEDFNKIHKKYFIENGDVLLTIVGSIGRTAIVENYNKEYTFQRSVAIINPEISSYFLNYYIQIPKVQKELKIRTNSSAQGGIYLNELSKIKINCPSENEQQKISNIFLALDQKIELMEIKRDKVIKLKNYFIQKLFYNKQNIPELRFPEFKGEWTTYKLGDICKFSKGKGISKKDVAEKGTPCIRYGELYTQYNELISETVSRTQLPLQDLILSEENDIIIPSTGETAIDISQASCIKKDNIAIGGDINILKTQEDGVFLSYYLNYIKNDIAKMAQGISVIHLYADQLKSLNVNIPSLEEQRKISKLLLLLNQKIDSMEKEIKIDLNFKKTLLNKMFC